MNRITITIVAALLTTSVSAQDFNRFEFSINAGGGMSNFQTKPFGGTDLWDWTGTAGWAFHLFFNPRWGIGIGTNITAYNNGISFNNYDRQQSTTNVLTGNAFDFMVNSPDFKAMQQTMMVTTPLMLQYQGVGKAAFYAAIGGKAGFSYSSFSIPKGIFTTKGYFPNLDVTYEDLPEFGFVTNQQFPETKTNIRLKTSYMASVELGVKWRLGKVVSLYTGIYADYGINDIMVKETAANTHLVVYQPKTPAQFTYNTSAHAYARQMAPLSGGITLRLAFGFKKTACPVCQVCPVCPVCPDCPPCPECIPCPPKRKKRQDKNQPDKTEVQVNADSIARIQEIQRRAEEEALRQAKAKAIFDIGEPIINYTLSQMETATVQIQQLDEKVALLQQFPDVEFYLIGHTCDVGTREQNERVGLARAENAKKYLISQGIAEKRILGTATKRDTEPLVPNSSEANRRINRRVQFIVKEIQ
jgi:outer membrane protein OmpA-like peptidoglycan-associated protein